MDAAWAEGYWPAMSPQTIVLGDVVTDLIHLPKHPGRHFVAMSAVLAAYAHPSPATWKRYCQRGQLLSEQPGGPNTRLYVEVAQNPGGGWEPVWSA